MRVGIGLNATNPGVERAQLLDWARAADERGFATLGTLDRLVYPNWDPLIALAGAAAVTSRIELVTSVILLPYRNTAVAAKEMSSLDQLSGGRLTIGVGLGWRDDDYEAAAMEGQRTGGRLEEQLQELRRIWGGEKLGFAGAIGPSPVRPDGIPIIVGGSVSASFKRAGRLGRGWILGGGTPDQLAEAAPAVRDAWQAEGRDGEPRLMALNYFCLGADAEQHVDAYIRDYYAAGGEDLASGVAASVATTEEMVQERIAAFRDAGCDDLILFPCSADPAQVGLLADAAGL